MIQSQVQIRPFGATSIKILLIKGFFKLTKQLKAKHVNSIVKHTADLLGMQTNEELEDFMDKTAWTLDAEHHKAGEVDTLLY